MDKLYTFLTELDKLKSVYRRSYLSDLSRRENSAEHSWHLAMAVLTVAQKFDLSIDVAHALKLALVHDIGEIDAGDLSVFDPQRDRKFADEKRCIERIAALDENFGTDIPVLWHEYEAQQTPESRWVKVLDRLLPFMANLRTAGTAWQEMDVSAKQVREVMAFIASTAPEIHAWMMGNIDRATEKNWLRDESD